MKPGKWFANWTARWADVIQQRRLALLVGVLLLWPTLSFWSQRRDNDNSKEEPSKDDQQQGLLFDVSAIPGAAISLPNEFFGASNLDELLEKVSADFNYSGDASYAVHLPTTALEFESFVFMADSLAADHELIDAFLSIPYYQVYMLGYSEPVDSVAAADEDDDEPVAWYQDYAYLLWGALAIVAGTAAYRLRDDPTADDAITITGDIATSIEQDEVPGEVVKSGQLIAASEQGESIAFVPDSVISQPDSLGQLTITEDGVWTFTVDNELIKFLAADEVLEQLFVVTTVTGLEQEITVQIKGLNDAPELDDISRLATESDEAFVIDLLADSNATDIDGDALVLVAESVRLIDENVDAGGIVFDVTTSSFLVNPSYYSSLGNNESLTISFNFSVTDGLVATSKIVTIDIQGDAAPTVDIMINERSIDDVAIIELGSSSVSFVFSELVTDFTSSDISLSLGRIENLRQDPTDAQVWLADLNLTAADMTRWQYGQVAEISIDRDRFTDVNGNFNTTGDSANYLAIVDRSAIIDDAIAVIDNFIHPESYYSDSNPNLLFEGTDGNDYIDAFTGDNIIYGRAGADILVAAGGDDVFIGGTGDDLLIDGRGDDVYVGGAGNDTLLLNLDGQQQDIFIGGAGFDRVVIAGSLKDYNLAFASYERIDLTNDYLTHSRFDLADVSTIVTKLSESTDNPIDPFIELALTSYAADGVLTLSERIEFSADYGDSAATLLWDLPAFRSIKANEIEGFDAAVPVIELMIKNDVSIDDPSTYSADLLQAEMLIFDDATVHILDGVLLTEAEGTDGADLFFLALPEQINEQSGLTYTLNDFSLSNDSIVIEGLFLQDNNGDLIDVESDTLLDYLTLDETGQSGQIDLSAFVDSEGNTVTGEVMIKLAPVTDDNLAEAADAIGASIYKTEEDFAPAIGGDF